MQVFTVVITLLHETWAADVVSSGAKLQLLIGLTLTLTLTLKLF